MSIAIDKFNAVADLIETSATALSDGWIINRTMLFLTDTGGVLALERAMGNPIRYIEVLLQDPVLPDPLLAGGQIKDIAYTVAVDIYFEYEPTIIFTGSTYKAFLEAMTAETTGVIQKLFETFTTGGFAIGNPEGAIFNELRLIDSKQNKLAHYTTFTIEVY